jgi:hypothetical protein
MRARAVTEGFVCEAAEQFTSRDIADYFYRQNCFDGAKVTEIAELSVLAYNQGRRSIVFSVVFVYTGRRLRKKIKDAASSLHQRKSHHLCVCLQTT